MHPSVRLTAAELPRLDSPLVIGAFRGWHDGTGTAVAAIRYLRTEWGAVEVANLDPERYYDMTVARPHVQLRNDERIIRWPGTRFYVVPSVAGARDVVLLAGREPSFAWRNYCDALCDVMVELGAKQFLALGSRPALVPHTRPAGIGLTDADESLSTLLGIEPTQGTYQGPTGIHTVLAVRLREGGLDAARLTARIPSYVTAGPNPKAVLALVEQVDRVTGRQTSLGSLRGSIMAFEQQTEAALDQLDNPRQMRAQIAEMERVYDESDREAAPAAPEPTVAELPSTESLIGDIEALLRERRQGPDSAP
ncbi:MAG: PAC2 family protein [Dehalococcoidia bacterium]|nr:PAC2 family protein [Dehalococcoidia bacterium]